MITEGVAAVDWATRRRNENANDQALIRVSGLCKSFKRKDGSTVNAIDNVSLDIPEGAFVVLLGPSGCGKTTLLRAIAGLQVPDEGTILIDGSPVFSSDRNINVPPEHRNLSMVFQSYALWPHMTVFENVAYPLRRRKVAEVQIWERVEAVLKLVGIPAMGMQYSAQLSGGQQQRVALARALVVGRGIILFDEPLSNVDARVREELRSELLKMHSELGFTAVYVTHDQFEAMELASQLAVMRGGKVAQLDTPQTVYNLPKDLYVATFLGSANEMGGVLEREGDGWCVRSESGDRICADTVASGLTVGQTAFAVLRPEHLELHSQCEGWHANFWDGIVRNVIFLGQYTDYLIECDRGRLIRVRHGTGDLTAKGKRVRVSIAPSKVVVVPP